MDDKNVKLAATLTPVRYSAGELELFLSKRAYWDSLLDKPMRYPGEYIVIGGGHEEQDANLEETAVREFREEVFYAGEIRSIELFKVNKTESKGVIYEVHMYTGEIDDFVFEPKEGGEVLECKWMTPKDALELIRSDEFTQQQLEEFKRRDLGNEKYGKFAAIERELPKLTIQMLEYFNSL